MDIVPVTARTLEALSPARSFASFTAPVSSLAFTDDSQFLLASNDTNSLQVFDVTAGTQVCTTEDFTQDVALVCPTHHHHALLYANAQGSEPTVTYFNWKLQQCIWRTTETTRRIVQICMSPATDAFLCISADANLQLFDLRQRRSIYRHRIENVYGVCAAAFDPTGTIFALGASDPRNSLIRLWDFRTLQAGPYFTKTLPGGIPVTSLEFSDDGKLALMCTSDCKVTLLDAFSLTIQHTIQLDAGLGAIAKAVFSACSKFIACGVSSNNGVELFETATGERVHRLEGAGGVRALGWNKDYLMLAVGGETVDLWLPEL
jgi:WD40 repeat protein